MHLKPHTQRSSMWFVHNLGVQNSRIMAVTHHSFQMSVSHLKPAAHMASGTDRTHNACQLRPAGGAKLARKSISWLTSGKDVMEHGHVMLLAKSAAPREHQHTLLVEAETKEEQTL